MNASNPESVPAIVAAAAGHLHAQVATDVFGPAIVVAPPALHAPVPAGWRMPVAELTVLRVHGPDAARFLQGQLTADIDDIGPGQARFAAFCSPKGRMLASFLVAAFAAGDFRLVMSRNLGEAIARRLRMFVLRSKVSIESFDDTCLPIGILCPPDALPVAGLRPLEADAHRAMIRLADIEISGRPTARMLVVDPDTDWAGQWQALEPLVPAPGAWFRAAEILAGEARIIAATSDRFVPQMVNFELIGGVDFDKGCFTGQEVIARSQHLGRLKRRLVLARSDAPAQPGEDIPDADGAPAFTVVSHAPADLAGAPGASLMLLEAPAEIAHAGAKASLPDGLTALDLPYEIPEHRPFVRPKL